MSSSPFTVLVVDDDPVTREIATEAFRCLGYTVSDAYNAHDALRLISSNPDIGLLFADMRMWGMRGVELAREARKIRPHLEVVLTSGYPTDSAALEFPFVAKPWRKEDLAMFCASARLGPVG